MKKFLLLAALIAIPLAAWAGGQVQFVAQNPVGTLSKNGPLTATSGIPVSVNGAPITSATVTIQSVWDGGDPDEYIFANILAFKYDPYGTGSDGGIGYTWSRYPQLDLVMDAGIPIAGAYTFASSSISGTMAVPALPANNRLTWMYSAVTAGAPDGGTNGNAVVNVMGRY